MDSEQLRALADTVNSIYAETYTQREAIDSVVAYLRAQAEAQPVGEVTNLGGILSTPLPVGTKLYAHPAPAAPQAELDDDDALVLGEPDMLTPEDVRRLVPQAEPKREPLTVSRILEIEADANRKWHENGRLVKYAVVFARMVERELGIGGSDAE